MESMTSEDEPMEEYLYLCCCPVRACSEPRAVMKEMHAHRSSVSKIKRGECDILSVLFVRVNTPLRI
jgi:hypothetical protein